MLESYIRAAELCAVDGVAWVAILQHVSATISDRMITLRDVTIISIASDPACRLLCN
jgi:hypothetical protein